jgi:hypothetical protein
VKTKSSGCESNVANVLESNVKAAYGSMISFLIKNTSINEPLLS